MNPAIAVHDATCRILAHAGRAHVMPATGQVGGPRGWIIVDLDAESAETGPSQLRTEELEGAHDAALLDLRELPVELDAAHPECVSFLREAHAAVRIGNLLDPRREPDSLEWQAARDLPESGCRKIAEH